MSEEQLSNLAGWIYTPSILLFVGIIVFAFLWDYWLPTLSGAKRFFAWIVTTAITMGVFAATLLLAFHLGGCFESCTGKTDDEVGLLKAGIVNWFYIFIVLAMCIRRPNKYA